jgi:plastocyanin
VRGAVLTSVLAAVLALLVTRPAGTNTTGVEAVVKDERGKPVSDAVVSLTSPGAATAPSKPASAIMDQQNKEFVPFVLPVAAGTSVAFPNRDNIRHHVYSFSAAKRFELPLYIGTPAAPVLFDTPGTVVLGCNIHDWMVGYIYVVATPYFAKTAEDGAARITDVPAGTYEARVWHPRLRAETDKTVTPVTIAPGEPARVTFAVALKPDRRPPRRPGYEGAQGGS